MRIIVEPRERVVYVECRGLVVCVNPTDEGIVVDIFADDEDNDEEDCVASTYAFYPHKEEDMCEYCEQRVAVEQGLCAACLGEQRRGV